MPSLRGSVRQAGVIPIKDGRICLVMSSSGKRWVIPKGCIEHGQPAGVTALQEAWEEAGLVGILKRQPVGSYVYEKADQTCHVTVFFMEVTEVTSSWPERTRRLRRWFSPERALERIEDEGLQQILWKVFSMEEVELSA